MSTRRALLSLFILFNVASATLPDRWFNCLEFSRPISPQSEINDLPRVATISPLYKIAVRLSPARLNSNQCILVYLTDSYQLADKLTAHVIKHARRRTAPHRTDTLNIE